MPDDGNAVDAEQCRAAELGVVDALGETPKNRVENVLRGRNLRLGLRHAVQQIKDHLSHAFAALHQNVAPKAVADDDVNGMFKDIFTFDVAEKVQRRGLQKLMRFFCQLVALCLLPSRYSAGRLWGWGRR